MPGIVKAQYMVVVIPVVVRGVEVIVGTAVSCCSTQWYFWAPLLCQRFLSQTSSLLEVFIFISEGGEDSDSRMLTINFKFNVHELERSSGRVV